jgi:short subunit dehydrogenase-like uncharacterized protein
MAPKKKTGKRTAQAKKTAESAATKKNEARPPKRVSALAAAARVLAETGTPMSCGELIEVMAEKKYWSSPAGKTPASTLYSAILRELKTKGRAARFQKTERGKFSHRASA